MKKFEYLSVNTGDFYSEEEDISIDEKTKITIGHITNLNKLGAEGWEVVSSYRDMDSEWATCLLKREVQ
jgi:hypothetical protein